MSREGAVGCLKLLAAGAIVAVVWLWFLPFLAGTETVVKHTQLLDEYNINAGAMFYTEVQERR